MRHPEPEVIAAFADGNLAGDEQRQLTDHLGDCSECRELLGVVVGFNRDARPRMRAWMPLAAAAIIAVIAGGTWMLHVSRDPIRQLVAAAPRDNRDLEPRLAGGFAYAPMKPVMRGGSDDDPSRWKLLGAAGKIVSEKSSRHAVGVAQLLSGRRNEALNTLLAIPVSERDAAIWNDLAAAQYAMRHYDDALASADQTLKLDNNNAEARFNRALILDRLNRRDEARRAWQSYLAIDPNSAWANEARERAKQ